MGSETLLRSACELSYEIARDGAEADPAIEPPPAMREYLYVTDLAEPALTVAQQAIEDDPAFRRRVASMAREADVGRAGYLWLHRPIGWAAEFEELSSDPEESNGVDDRGGYADNGHDASGFDIDPGRTTDLPAGAASALGFGSVDGLAAQPSLDAADDEPEQRSEANAFEDELSSLRGLVDRLSSERRAVSTSVRRVEADVQASRTQPSSFDGDIYSLQSELDAMKGDLAQARAERDTAVQQRSESLTRQLELERELERSRELRAELEREHEEVDLGVIELRESLARAEATVASMEDDRADLENRVGDLSTTSEALNRQIAQMAEEHTASATGLQGEIDRLTGENETLTVDRAELQGLVDNFETDLGELKTQLGQATGQAAEAQSLVDALTEEKIDLASRLADTEAMLETTRTQLQAVKADSEAVAADLSSIKAHRDGLASQVDELHSSLSEALNDLAKVRSTSDADRAALKEIRSERDLLRVRVGSLEQIETGLEAKMTNLAAERDTLAAKAEEAARHHTDLLREHRTVSEERDRLVEDVDAARRSTDTTTSERDELSVELERVRAELTDLRVNRDGLQQQVEQLNEENSSLQAQVVEGERLRVEAAENQGHAVSELAQRLSLVENERTRLEADLSEVQGKMAEAVRSAETARSDVATVRSERDSARAELASARERADASSGDGAGFPVVDDSMPSTGGDTDRPSSDAGDQPEQIFSLASEDGDGQVAALDGGDSPAAIATSDGGPDNSVTGSPPAVVAEPETETPPPPPPPTAEDLVAARIDAPPPSAADAVDEPAPIDIESGMAEAIASGLGSSPPEVVEPGESTDAGSDPVADVDDDGEADGDAASSPFRRGRTSRRSWGRGTRLRSDDPVDPADALFDDGDESAESVAAALAETLDADLGAEPPPVSEVGDVSEDELDTISSELSAVVADAPVDPDDEDLDEISNLISKTVTDFDPSATGGTPAVGSDSSSVSPIDRGRPRSLPPSVFNEGADTAGGALFGGPESDEDTSVFPAGGPGPVVAGRRQIDIPAEVADDDVEMARHVVSSPDVVLLVDGDAVAKMGWPSLPVAQQRDALVSYLADLSATLGAAPDVVFDGRIGEEESLPASRSVRIRLSTPPTEPAAALDELVDAYPEQWPIAIVTDDTELGRSATERGAVVLNNGQLLDLFIS